MGSSRSGYEHRYRVSLLNQEGYPKLHCRSYILDVRTNFILKPIGPGAGAGETLIDAERFCDQLMLTDYETPITSGPPVTRACSGKNMVDLCIRGRLSKYLMSDAQIRALAQMAYDYVHRVARDPRYDSFRTIPVLVGIDVCTVQLEGEPLDATIDRLVKPDFLIPLQLQRRSTYNNPNSDLRYYLSKLQIVRLREDGDHNDDVDEEGFLARVESCPLCLNKANVSLHISSPAENYAFHQKHSLSREEGLRLMEVCPICLREPIVGAQIASLPCKHAFHDHCVVRWLLKSNSCPVCRMEIVFKEDYRTLLKKRRLH